MCLHYGWVDVLCLLVVPCCVRFHDFKRPLCLCIWLVFVFPMLSTEVALLFQCCGVSCKFVQRNHFRASVCLFKLFDYVVLAAVGQVV